MLGALERLKIFILANAKQKRSHKFARMRSFFVSYICYADIFSFALMKFHQEGEY